MRRVPLVRVRQLYRQHFVAPRRELLFLSGVSFFVTFGITRGVTGVMLHLGGGGGGPKIKGVHIHHQVIGILMVLGSGYGWLHLAGIKRPDDHLMLRRANTVVYGTGSALTLDEIALWLNLDDVYWKSPWRELIDGGIISISLASIAYWGRPFFQALAQEATGGASADAPRVEVPPGPPSPPPSVDASFEETPAVG